MKGVSAMIISRKHEYIFIAVPRTGSHSIRDVLHSTMGENDLEQVSGGSKVLPFPELAKIPHGHITAQQIRPFLGDDTFLRYKKFAFVRNPFDRFVSACAFDSSFLKADLFQVDPTRFMKFVIKVLRPWGRMTFFPQYTFITDESGALSLDLLGRTETMQSSFDTICDSIGLERVQLPHVHTSKHKPYQEYYDQELRDMVSGIYRKDLELFDYQF